MISDFLYGEFYESIDTMYAYNMQDILLYFCFDHALLLGWFMWGIYP